MTAQMAPVPDFFECGYRDGVWLTEPDMLFLDDDIDFSEGDMFFLMFTTYHLGDEPIGERKNLMGVEAQYSTHELADSGFSDLWGIKINKYVDLGTVRGRKEWRKLNKRGEFDHIEAVYGFDKVKYVGQCVNFDELAIQILRYVEKTFPAENLTADAAEVIRYYRPLEVPEEAKAWYSDGQWLTKYDFEVNGVINLDYITPEMPGEAFIFTSNNFMKGNEAELGVFLLMYHELPSAFETGQWTVESGDFYPDEGEFRFLGFIGPHYQIPSLETVETYLNSNEVLWESFYNSRIDFTYLDKVNTFADLRDGIAESMLLFDSASARKMNIFK